MYVHCHRIPWHVTSDHAGDKARACGRLLLLYRRAEREIWNSSLGSKTVIRPRPPAMTPDFFQDDMVRLTVNGVVSLSSARSWPEMASVSSFIVACFITLRIASAIRCSAL